MGDRELLITHVCEAFITVDRPVFPRNERNFTFGPTGGTGGRMHLTRASASVLFDLPTLHAPAGLIKEPSLLIEFLFTGSENEFLIAVTTN